MENSGQYPVCEHEHKLTPRLYSCHNKERCEWQKILPYPNTSRYCLRAPRLETGKGFFRKESVNVENLVQTSGLQSVSLA